MKIKVIYFADGSAILKNCWFANQMSLNEFKIKSKLNLESPTVFRGKHEVFHGFVDMYVSIQTSIIKFIVRRNSISFLRQNYM